MLCLFVYIAICWKIFKSSQPRLGWKVDPYYYGIAHMQMRALLSVKMTCSDFSPCDIFGEYDEENPQKRGFGVRRWVYEKMDCKTLLEHPQTVGKGEAAPNAVPSPF